MKNLCGSSRPLVLALTLLISSCWQYHVTHGTTVPTKSTGGGTTTLTANRSTTTNATGSLPQLVDSPAFVNSTNDIISTKIQNRTAATNTSQLTGGHTVLTYRKSRNLYNTHSRDTAHGTNGTATVNSEDNSVDSLKGDLVDQETSDLLGEFGANGGTTDEEEVTGRYYHHEEGTTGTNIKARKYSKQRVHYKQTYKDGPNPGTPSHNPMASDTVALDNYPVQPTTIMMVGNPNTMKGYNDESSNGNRKKDKTDLMTKILPMMIMPFLISTSLIPMMLTSLKFMLLKSLFVGKIAIVLLVINALWRIDNKGGVYSHNVHGPFSGGGGGMFGAYSGGGYAKSGMDKDLNMAHYGYNGDEEYGAYVNHRR